jgi:transketolase
MGFQLGPRRGIYIDITQENREPSVAPEAIPPFERLDVMYRALCAMLYNYVPMSGHPGGSISSGRFVAGIVFDSLDYDVSDPDREDADIISYAAGHKTLGLYAMWALRNEVMRIGAPELLPKAETQQLRLEDLLGFRRNPLTKTPLFLKYRVKPLDGHPTPATPFLRLSTGASGVGVAASLGLAFGAADYYASHAPRIHIVEGEGGHDARPRRRGHGRGRYRLPQERDPARGLEPGLHRFQPGLPGWGRPGRIRPVEPGRVRPAARLERHFGPGRDGFQTDPCRPAAGRDPA